MMKLLYDLLDYKRNYKNPCKIFVKRTLFRKVFINIALMKIFYYNSKFLFNLIILFIY